MRPSTRLAAVLMVGPGWLIGPWPAAAQTSATVVALSGTAAPAGGNYSSFTNTSLLPGPVVNGSGQVAFFANLTGGSSTAGLFVGAPGSVQAVALQGTPAPAGGNYRITSLTNPPVLNGSGRVAFSSELTGGSSTGGVFVGAPGSVQAVALQGTPAPAGGTYGGVDTPVLNGSGRVAFFANLTGGSSTQGIFVGASGSVQAAALQNTPAPAGGTYSNFAGRPVLNGSGQVAFPATLTGGSSTQGIFVGAPGAVQAAALQGTPAPAGGNYNAFDTPALNGSGQVAFFASLTGGESSRGVFAGAPGAVQPAALQNTAAPAGGTYVNFYTPMLNGSGQVAFAADLTGGSSTSGVFVGAPGAVLAAALQGDAAPGGGAYRNFANNRPVLNASGEVAFYAFLTGAGVTTANDVGLYAGSVGALLKVVREGDQVDVGAGVMRTVADNGITFSQESGGQDGRAVSFSDTGFITFSLRFTDGSSGVFRSSVAPVPEPASAGLVAAAGLAAVGWLKRRGGWRAA